LDSELSSNVFSSKDVVVKYPNLKNLTLSFEGSTELTEILKIFGTKGSLQKLDLTFTQLLDDEVTLIPHIKMFQGNKIPHQSGKSCKTNEIICKIISIF
jgi:hypothetical protein